MELIVESYGEIFIVDYPEFTIRAVIKRISESYYTHTVSSGLIFVSTDHYCGVYRVDGSRVFGKMPMPPNFGITATGSTFTIIAQASSGYKFVTYDVSTALVIDEVPLPNDFTMYDFRRFSRDGRLAVFREKKGFAVVSTVDGSIVFIINAPQATMVEFSPDNSQIYIDSDDDICRIELSTKEITMSTVHMKEPALGWTTRFCLSLDGRRVVCVGENGRAQVLDSTTFKTIYEIPMGDFLFPVFDPTGEFIIGRTQTKIALIDVSGTVVKELDIRNNVLGITFDESIACVLL
jgi:hypothetical protein